MPIPTPTILNPSILHIDIYENETDANMLCNIVLTYNGQYASGAVGYIKYNENQVEIPLTDSLGKSEFNYSKGISVELVETYKGLVIDRYL